MVRAGQRAVWRMRDHVLGRRRSRQSTRQTKNSRTSGSSWTWFAFWLQCVPVQSSQSTAQNSTLVNDCSGKQLVRTRRGGSGLRRCERSVTDIARPYGAKSNSGHPGTPTYASTSQSGSKRVNTRIWAQDQLLWECLQIMDKYTPVGGTLLYRTISTLRNVPLVAAAIC